MIQFILNDEMIKTSYGSSRTLLDFIRYEQNIRGTKIGCREGDCGACTVLIGKIQNDRLKYESVTSCLTPLANIHGAHVVTVEGLNLNTPNAVQQAMIDHSATQCGFCTPGFVVSLCGYALSDKPVSNEGAISSIDGNICRCTGYKSIERAAWELADLLIKKDKHDPISWLIKHRVIPEYFSGIQARLISIKITPVVNGISNPIIGGGTDLFVQKHDELHDADLTFLFNDPSLKGIYQEGNQCRIMASTTATDLIESPIFKKYIPGWHDYMKLVSSTPIRNIGTLAGNLVNASPIGDLTVIFLALGSDILLSTQDGKSRKLPLKGLYLDYKQLDLKENEIVKEISFEIPDASEKFHFEKVSKRKYLDIASVNSAIRIQLTGNTIESVQCSIGGVAPIPKYLSATSDFLTGSVMDHDAILSAAEVMQDEIAPISDARGSKEYKRLLARQLFYSHFCTLFPQYIQMESLV